MNLFSRLRPKNGTRRVFFLGLDGTPYALLQRMIGQGIMPNTAKLVAGGTLRKMRSVYPWVSSVAWTTFQTGVNPAKHNIYGFIDREPQTLKTFIPTARHLRAPAIWDILSAQGKKVVVMNVPVTFPPAPVNGVLISGFLAPRLEKAVYPDTLLPKLQELGYRVDTDPWLAREGRQRMLADVDDALEKRVHTLFYLMESQPWDFFLCVIMETDRLHHFLFEPMEQNDPVYAPRFFDVYRRIDAIIGQLMSRLDDHTTLVLMSDHGFCSIKQEVFFNRWLADAGYLSFSQHPAKSLADLSPQSAAYSMDPGRIFINLKGRERDGRIAPGAEYERLRDEIAAAAEALTDPATGERMVLKAYRREELYRGPFLDKAADLVLAPVNGYDPKGALQPKTLVGRDPAMVGMHSYDDAMLVVGDHRLAERDCSLLDVAPTLFSLMNLPAPVEGEGQSLV